MGLDLERQSTHGPNTENIVITQYKLGPIGHDAHILINTLRVAQNLKWWRLPPVNVFHLPFVTAQVTIRSGNGMDLAQIQQDSHADPMIQWETHDSLENPQWITYQIPAQVSG